MFWSARSVPSPMRCSILVRAAFSSTRYLLVAALVEQKTLALGGGRHERRAGEASGTRDSCSDSDATAEKPLMISGLQGSRRSAGIAGTAGLVRSDSSGPLTAGQWTGRPAPEPSFIPPLLPRGTYHKMKPDTSFEQKSALNDWRARPT